VGPSFQAKTVKVIVPNGGFGCQYSREHDRLYIAQYWNEIALVENVTTSNPNYRVLGTGYVHPAGIAVTSDGKTLYLTDNGTDAKVDGLTDKLGRLLSVDLTSPNGGNRDQAILLHSAQKAFHQITLDEMRGDIYFVTSKVGDPNLIQTYTGSLIRFHLETSEVTVLADNLAAPFGFLLSSDHRTAYTIERQTAVGLGALIRHDLVQGKREVLWASTGQLLFCAWGNVNESAVIVPNRSRGVVWYIDVSKMPVEAYQIGDLSVLPSVPNSTTRLTDELFPLLVSSDMTIAILDQ
jgi:DNA-binding beta-propeller fold protein YncE